MPFHLEPPCDYHKPTVLRDSGSMKLKVCFATSLVLASLSVAAPPFAVSQPAQTSHPAQTQRPSSTPYSGDLSIFENPGRDERLQIQRVMDLLSIRAGSSVADLGAGSGWFTIRAAARVGAGGVVYAEDINPDAVTYIQNRVHKENVSNVKTVLGSPDDPKLPPHSIDAVLLLKVYHEIAQPLSLLANLKPSLRPGAKIGIIDRNGTGADHGLDSDVVKREMAEAGFKLVSSHDFTKADGQDYFLVFTLK